MSGTPPPEPSKDPAQLAGRRRKRSDSPPSTTATPTISTLPAIVEQPTPRYGERTATERRREDPTMQIAPHPLTYLPPLTYGAPPVASIAQYTPQDLISSQQQVSPRTTRKTKAHVASACINCKKKHLRCDSSRPCRRCVQSGKEDTCKDVEHKKRGRPPLKPEDPALVGRRAPGPAHLGAIHDHTGAHHGADPRGYHPSNYPPILPNAPPPLFGHHRASSRSSLYSGLQSPYAAPTIAPSPMTATALHFSYPNRPQSTSSSVSTQSHSHSHSPYTGQPSYPSHGLSRQVQPYSSYPFHPVEIPPTTQPFYGNPIFPREQMPPPMPAESQYSHGLQLPPIRHTQHGAFDPSITQQQLQRQQAPEQGQSRRAQSGERDPKRPKMDIQGILGPKHD